MNYYEHHLGDYAKDTTSLSMLEEGAYRRLLDVYYAKELPLPGNLNKVCKAARAISKQEKEAVLSVLDEFFALTPDGYRHKRCDEEIERYQASQEGAEDKRENDKDRQRRARERRKVLFEELRGHGVVPPWDAKTHELEAHLSRVTKPPQFVPVTRDESPPVTRDNTATQTPDTRHQTPKKNTNTAPSGGEPDGFAEFWRRYPRKTAKPNALKAFKAARPNGHLPEILADIDSRVSGEWAGKEQQYIPHPATYLNQRRWEDETGDLLQRNEAIV